MAKAPENKLKLVPRGQQRHYRPVARRGRDELIVTVRKITVEVRLEGWRSCPDQPRPVFHLRVDKVSHSAVVSRVTRRQDARLPQPDQRLARSIGIGGQRRNLSPPAIGPLQRQQL